MNTVSWLGWVFLGYVAISVLIAIVVMTSRPSRLPMPSSYQPRVLANLAELDGLIEGPYTQLVLLLLITIVWPWVIFGDLTG